MMGSFLIKGNKMFQMVKWVVCFYTSHTFPNSEWFVWRTINWQVRCDGKPIGFIIPNHFTAQSACLVLMSHVCPSRAFEHGRWVSMMACLSHPSLTDPSMQNYACATVAAAQGQVLFWESKGARDAMIA